MAQAIDELRKEIDEITIEIISLIDRRMNLVKSVALYKKTNSMDIIDKSREKSVLELFEQEFVSRNLSGDGGRLIARALIDAAILEENMINNSLSSNRQA